MSDNISKRIKDGVFNGFYSEHSQGQSLFDIDLQELIDKKCEEVEGDVRKELTSYHNDKVKQLEDDVEERDTEISELKKELDALREKEGCLVEE